MTLLELLIVLALLLAMAVAVGPTVISTLDERAFDATVDVTSRQMMLARAHAQASGKPVEVVCFSERSPSRVIAREFVVVEGEPRDADALIQSWADRSLPHGYAILAHLPRNDEARIGGVEAQPVEATVLRLGVFLPDGSAMAGSPRWLSDGEGRVARMTVNPFTGEAQFTRLPPEDLRAAANEADDLTQWDAP